MKEHCIAVYIRLSMADEDTGKNKTESDSVINQRNLIRRFLDRHQELSGCSRTEFCDDGFTGTNMDRPAFQEMMARVKKGEFDLICVKDFSRFSRDYIEIGDCLECLFPFLGVRFLSINDGYDSADYKGTTGGMGVVMRNIVYAAYSKDLSMKTTSAKLQLMKQGKYVGSFAPYGFSFHPTQRNKLVADPEAAAVVRSIFALAAEGYSVTEIAKVLNRENVPTPGQYFKARHPTSKKYTKMSGAISWSYAMVHNILTKQAYTGAAVGHMRRIVAPLSRKTVKLDKEDQIIVEGAHEALISPEDFRLAQRVIRKTGAQGKRTPQRYPLRSLVRCGLCGRAMTRSDSGNFYCPYGKSGGPCSTADKYQEKELEALVFGSIQMFLDAALKDEAQREKAHRQGALQSRQRLSVLTGLQKEAERLKKQKLVQYERYSGGEISKAVYLEQKAGLDQKLAGLEAEITRMEEESAGNGASCPEESRLAEAVKAYREMPVLTWEMAHAFVEAIYVYPDGRREIHWKFKEIAP
jgi:DNA invertase Pin-like site-specific DNA recombinase